MPNPRRKPWAYLAEGNCLELMRAIPDGGIDMVLCDLPYGITECKWDKKIALGPLWEQYVRVARPGVVIALFAQQPFATELANGAPGKMLRYEWIWDKGCATGFANARRMPLRRHENILVFYKKLPTYNPQGLRPCFRTCRRRTTERVYGITHRPRVQTQTGYPQSIIKFSREHGAAACQKPVALLEFLIRTYTDEREVVLDNTMGTGSSGVAAANAQRSFVGIEMDPVRFRAAEERIAAAMAQHGICRSRSLWAREGELA